MRPEGSVSVEIRVTAEVFEERGRVAHPDISRQAVLRLITMIAATVPLLVALSRVLLLAQLHDVAVLGDEVALPALISSSHG